MDDDRTEPVELPGVAPSADPLSPVDPPPASADPPPADGPRSADPAGGPATPPPPPAPVVPVGWHPPGQPPAVALARYAPAPPRLVVGPLVGRTFDTFGREWSLFLLLSLPSGIVGFLSAWLTPSMQASLRGGARTSPEEQLGSAGLTLVLSLFSLFGTIGTVLVTDAYWRGTAIGLGETIRRAAGLLPRAIGLFLLLMLVVLGISIPVAFVVLVAGLVGAAMGLGSLLLFAAALVAIALGLWASLRLTPMYAVLLLERLPVTKVFGRAWALSRGNVLPLLGLALVMGIVTFLPTWGSLTFNLFVDDRLIAGIASGLSTLVVAPVGVIWTVLAWATLSGAPYHDNDVMTTGKGRSLGFLVVAAVGIMLLVTGGTIAAEGSREFLRLIGG